MSVYFKDSRFHFSGPGEFLVRLITCVVYTSLVAAAFILFFSDLSSLRWLSVLFWFFLIDRLIHFGEAERSLFELKSENPNLAEVLTPAAYRNLQQAFRRSLIVNENIYLLLLKSFLDRRDVKEALRRLDVSMDEFSAKVDEYLEKSRRKTIRSEALTVIQTLVITGYENALRTNEKFIEARNIFVALALVKDANVAKIFELFNIKETDLEAAIICGRYRKLFGRIHRLPSVLGGFAHQPKILRSRVMNRAWTARPTPVLDRFSTDLTSLAEAEKVGFLIGHNQEFQTLLNIISQPGKPNALLVGEPGAGKSTIIAHLAFRMVKDDVPPVLFDKRLISLEFTSLIAEATPEVLAERLRKISEEIIMAGNIVLFIPNIHDLFRTAEKKSINAIDIFLPIVKNASIPVIGETYPHEFKQYIEPRSDFLEQFETVDVEELNDKETLQFLIYMSLILEREFRIFITLRAVIKAVYLAKRYFRNKLLPGSAVDLLKQAIIRAKERELKQLSDDIIIEVAEEKSRIPIQKAGAAETEKLLNLEKIIHERLVNQEAAVKAVSNSLREYRSGLSRQGGPIATFLFVGPTGVGKTELAKILANTQFGSKEAMERFDMSEYQDKQSVFRFIGTPDGSKTGSLTDAVLARPYSLILLDEFEKAHPDVLNLFLQVFDDGRLTDSLGRTVSFENTIIVATSNAHSEFIKSEIEKERNIEEIGEELKKKLTDYFKPELLNRFSNVIVFRGLKMEEVKQIAGFFLKEVAGLLEETHGIKFEVDEEAVGKLAELGWSPVFGARPLRQVISEKVKSPLAEKILKKEIGRGNKIILQSINNALEFRVVE